jgi:hypothetical protein
MPTVQGVSNDDPAWLEPPVALELENKLNLNTGAMHERRLRLSTQKLKEITIKVDQIILASPHFLQNLRSRAINNRPGPEHVLSFVTRHTVCTIKRELSSFS